jgi:alanyl-tRNA synthetase
MTGNDLRQKYINFFKTRAHSEIASASLIPENDPSLLFVNSGMSPLVPYLLGEKHPAGERLVNSQKCFRAEDIDEVGDGRHNTFFEMLGNWSLGDYFKKEQLSWWFEFLFEELEIDPNRIYQTIYAGSLDGQIEKDLESRDILIELYKRYGVKATEGPSTQGIGEIGPGKEIDFSQVKIFAYRDKNWWQRGEAQGELGGPDSETFYDTLKEHDSKFGRYCHPNCECGRFIEIGNSVFMQYQKTKDSWQKLDKQQVDFGGGLERILMALENKDNIFETDLFLDLILLLEKESNTKYQDNKKAFEVIVDHIKASTFLIGDDRGVSPSNSDQGYLVRRLIRRAVRFARQLNVNKENLLINLAQLVIDKYQDHYPELKNNQDRIIEEISKEEKKFKRTLEKGIIEFNKLATKDLDASDAFKLYQSYGFPLEMIEELAREKNIKVDKEGFLKEQKKHQDLSRNLSAGKFKGGLADSGEATTKLHTAAHLLLASLRKVLGEHVSQKGSNITAERLRFDFSHPQKMSSEEIAKVEELVNQAISQAYTVRCKEMDLSEAKEIKAMGVFEDRYDQKVKVYFVGKEEDCEPEHWSELFSKEICGGPHVSSLKDLGQFKIIKESSSSSGVRRIKAKLL